MSNYAKNTKFTKLFKYTEYTRTFSEDNIANFKNLLKHEKWTDVYTKDSTDWNKKYQKFHDTFQYFLNKPFPIKKSFPSKQDL